ncbi:UDP-glycoslytransferase 3 [Artemisia annua]|uniref:Glycosyltransferase n=1 Tax=Artemisia annua TaxID=35608 RepID=A0A2U1QJ72_ARTAN|nr:UDP-glycoslytransferase 3 [Artemisia annua]
MEKLELVFIPAPLMGHVGQAIALANLLIKHFEHLTITVIIVELPINPVATEFTSFLSSTISNERLNFIRFPSLPLESFTGYKYPGELRDLVLARQKPLLRDILASRLADPNPTYRLAACVVSMLCTSVMDVINEFSLPTYVFFASNAAFLGTNLYFQALQEYHGQVVHEVLSSGTELAIPSYANPVLPSLLPFVITDEYSWWTRSLPYIKRYREAKGIIVNTFSELEQHALLSYDDKTPPVYAVGPIIKPEPPAENLEILEWLNDQPKSSVILLCFGSRGWLKAEQVREIAFAVERSGYRFIWALRCPPADGLKGFPGEYKDFGEVLPDGFLERTADRGKVVGWVPQQAVLSKAAIGGFVTHCGWNSVQESLWYGVPMATWPLYAEQRLDAFQLVKEFGLAVEITLDFNEANENQKLILAEDIENGIRQVMDSNNKIRSKVSETKNKIRMTLEDGGSSLASLRRLVDDFSS